MPFWLDSSYPVDAPYQYWYSCPWTQDANVYLRAFTAQTADVSRCGNG